MVHGCAEQWQTTTRKISEGTVRGGSVSVTRKDAANSNDAGFGDERICFEVPGVRNRVALFPILFCLGVWKKSA